MWRSEQPLITSLAVPQCQVTRLMISCSIHSRFVSLGWPTFLPTFTLQLINSTSKCYSIYCPSPGTRGLEKHLSFIWNPPWLSRKAETLQKHMQSIKETGNKKTQTLQCWDF